MSLGALLKTSVHDEVVEPSEGSKPSPQAVQAFLCGEIAVEVLNPPFEELPEETLDHRPLPSPDYSPGDLSLHLPEGEGRPQPTSIGDHFFGPFPIRLHQMLQEGVGVAFVPHKERLKVNHLQGAGIQGHWSCPSFLKLSRGSPFMVVHHRKFAQKEKPVFLTGPFPVTWILPSSQVTLKIA